MTKAKYFKLARLPLSLRCIVASTIALGAAHDVAHAQAAANPINPGTLTPTREEVEAPGDVSYHDPRREPQGMLLIHRGFSPGWKERGGGSAGDVYERVGAYDQG